MPSRTWAGSKEAITFWPFFSPRLARRSPDSSAQRKTAAQGDAHLAGTGLGREDFLQGAVQLVRLVLARFQPDVQPAGLDQRQYRAAATEFELLGAGAGDQRLDALLAWQLDGDAVVEAFAMDRQDPSVQLVACAGAEHQAADQVEVLGVFRGLQHLRLQGFQAPVESQQAFALGGQSGAAAALPPTLRSTSGRSARLFSSSMASQAPL